MSVAVVIVLAFRGWLIASALCLACVYSIDVLTMLQQCIRHFVESFSKFKETPARM